MVYRLLRVIRQTLWASSASPPCFLCRVEWGCGSQSPRRLRTQDLSTPLVVPEDPRAASLRAASVRRTRSGLPVNEPVAQCAEPGMGCAQAAEWAVQTPNDKNHWNCCQFSEKVVSTINGVSHLMEGRVANKSIKQVRIHYLAAG